MDRRGRWAPADRPDDQALTQACDAWRQELETRGTLVLGNTLGGPESARTMRPIRWLAVTRSRYARSTANDNGAPTQGSLLAGRRRRSVSVSRQPGCNAGFVMLVPRRHAPEQSPKSDTRQTVAGIATEPTLGVGYRTGGCTAHRCLRLQLTDRREPTDCVKPHVRLEFTCQIEPDDTVEFRAPQICLSQLHACLLQVHARQRPAQLP